MPLAFGSWLRASGHERIDPHTKIATKLTKRFFIKAYIEEELLGSRESHSL